jgi:hypothetical protein
MAKRPNRFKELRQRGLPKFHAAVAAGSPTSFWRMSGSRIVTIGQLILFSTKTGDAWLLDPANQLAARLAREGESEPIHIEETDTTFAIGWKGRYRIEGPAFVYLDEDTGRVATILAYPTDKLTQAV